MADSSSTAPTVRTRFAPSPTGELHIGGARTALFNWAYARMMGGQFVLRIEDTDQKRSSDQSMRNILRDLAWLGIDWDEGPTLQGDDVEVLGDKGPYFQSQRLDLYQGAIDQLKRLSRAYEDDGAVRFKATDQDVTVQDQILGPVTYPAGELEDFVIQKADGFPTFHLANVVDDASMSITHVLRGQEHLINTPKHLQLFDALGLQPPTYAHIPLIFNPDGSKMSKRDKAKAARSTLNDAVAAGKPQDELIDELIAYSHQTHKHLHSYFASGHRLSKPEVNQFLANKTDSPEVTVCAEYLFKLHLPEIDVADFRDAGYFPEVLCNYLALLGWNPGEDREKFDNDFLAAHFSFDRVGKSASKFDRDKLASFNQDHIKDTLSADERVAALQAFAGEHHPAFMEVLNDTTWPAFAEAYRERAKTLNDPFDAGAFFVAADSSFTYDLTSKAIKKAVLKGEPNGLQCLTEFHDTLAATDPWSGQAAHEAVEAWCAERELNMGKLAQPIRVAVSGTPVTPPIDLTLDILGKDRTLARIDRFLQIAAAQS